MKSFDRSKYCSDHNQAFSGLSARQSEDRAMSDEVHRSTVIILGEEHNTPAQRDYGTLLSRLIKMNAKIDCLFLEWNPNDEHAQNLIKTGIADSYKYFQHMELVREAKAKSLKIFAVDPRTVETKFDPSEAQAYIRRSNLGLHENVKRLFDSKTCRAGVLLIGKAHVEHPLIQILSEDSLKSLFDRDGTPTTAINLVYSAKNEYADNYDHQWKWPICTEATTEALAAPLVLGRETLNAISGMVQLPIRTFDYYLFLPKVDNARLYPPMTPE